MPEFLDRQASTVCLSDPYDGRVRVCLADQVLCDLAS